MKICILSVVNIKHMSQIQLFTSFLDRNSIEYDLVYVDKYGAEEKSNAAHVYRYVTKVNRSWSVGRKILSYLRFRRYAKKIIKEGGYEYLIVWRTETAYLFLDLLLLRFRKKFALNIRDYFHENNILFRQITKLLVRMADFTTISSPGFLRFLPMSESYVNVHSFNRQILSACELKDKKVGAPINICFIGYVRFFEQDRKLIRALGNDRRFRVQYIGEGAEVLAEYAKKNGIVNVDFIGGFPLEKTSEYLKDADVINNLYGFGDVALDTAVSIKFYYSLYLGIPILVFKDTYIGDLAEGLGIGYGIDPSMQSFADQLFSWYNKLDFDELRQRCRRKLVEVDLENAHFERILRERFAGQVNG